MSSVFVAAVALGALAALMSVIGTQRVRGTSVAICLGLASCLSLIVSLHVMATGRSVTFVTRFVIPVTGARVHLDPFGALFVAVTSVVAIAVSVYVPGYAKHHPISRTFGAALAVFVTAMIVVPAAWNVLTFLYCWELMAISSLVLVLTGYRGSASVRNAGVWYAVLTQVGAAAISFALIVASTSTHSQNFSSIAAHSALLGPGIRTTIFLVALAGFASKAGAVPLHVWLPKAHGEAPSLVSALMSAAMVNLGVYGIIRVGDTLLHGGPAWWWIVVIVLGALSAIYGAIHAATSSDLKRLLAYSTSDNLGLVLIAVGTSGLLEASGHHDLATFALLAGLVHVCAHAAFKGTLFLSAGSVQYATGTRDLDQLGGLAKGMPVTTLLFGVGAAAAMALPPLAGFVSEWLLLQGLLHGLATSSGATLVLMPLGVGALALTGGLTAAAFVKAFGVGFLGVARSPVAAQATEPPRLMSLGAAALAVCCVVLGVAPALVVSAVGRAMWSLNAYGPADVTRRGVSIATKGLTAAFDPTVVAVALLVVFTLVWGVRRVVSADVEVRRARPWGCGRTVQTSRMSYTATSFAEPLQRIFDDVVQPSQDLDVSHREESRYFVDSVRFASRSGDAFDRLLYEPVIRAVRAAANRARRIQNGSIHRYLAYSLVALIVVLLVAR